MRKKCLSLMASFLLFGLLACGGSSISPPSSADSDAPALLALGIMKTAGSSSAATGTTAHYYAGFGESISLSIAINNPAGYSISRFKINGTAFSSNSFTTSPIQPGQTTTMIRTEPITLGNTRQNITYTISDIKYFVEMGNMSGSEKEVLMNTDSVSSALVSVGFSGSGTVDDPYLINNTGRLEAVARCANGNIGGVDGYNGKYLKLTTDLDLADQDWTPIGTYNNDNIYDYSFKGTFDGNGKLIKNLTINSSLLKNAGLFGYVNGGTIKNVVLANSQITNTVVGGSTAGIAGTLRNGSIRNCSTSGSINGTGSYSYVAGIVALVSASSVSSCSNSASISGGAFGADHAGAAGIAGIAYGTSTIQNSYNTGSVSATGLTYNSAGGIAGEFNGISITNCYNTGAISVSNAGDSVCTAGAGIVGINTGSVTNSVWLDGSAGALSCAGTGSVVANKTSSDMMLQATYTDIGWDFSAVWMIDANEFPKLVWQKSGSQAEVWQQTGGPTTVRINSLATVTASGQTIYAGTDGGLFKSTNGSGSWSALTNGLPPLVSWLPPVPVYAVAADPADNQTIYIGTLYGVFKSANAGDAWSRAGNELESQVVVCLVLDPTNSQILYAGTNSGGAFKSIDGGGSWNAISTGFAPFTYVMSLAIDPTDSEVLYAGTSSEGVFKSVDSGMSWSAVNNGLPVRYIWSLAVDPSDNQIIYAATNGAGVFKSTDAGVSWYPTGSRLTQSFVLSLLLDPATQTIYAGTYYEGTFKSTDGGDTWSAIDSGPGLRTVWSLAIDATQPRAIYAGTEDGTMLKGLIPD